MQKDRMARTRGLRALVMGTGCRRGTDGENRALFRGGGDVVQGGGGGDLALVDLIGGEGQRHRVLGPVIHQVGPDISWQMLEKGTRKEKASLLAGG